MARKNPREHFFHSRLVRFGRGGNASLIRCREVKVLLTRTQKIQSSRYVILYRIPVQPRQVNRHLTLCYAALMPTAWKYDFYTTNFRRKRDFHIKKLVFTLWWQVYSCEAPDWVPKKVIPVTKLAPCLQLRFVIIKLIINWSSIISLFRS